jgi:glycosyltransferase involved in cell wall biosynthesis
LSASKHIVFFTPTLNRTGSEIVLLNLLQNNTIAAHISIVTKYKGELFNKIPKGINKQFLYTKQYGGLLSKLINKYRELFVVSRILKKHLNATWYINTMILPDILEFAETHQVKTIIHLHELKQMYVALSEIQLKRLMNYPELIIANSKASANVYKDFGGKKNMEIVYPSLNEEFKNKTDFNDFKSQFNIKSTDFVWVMCGTIDKNKNPFLFIDIALELKKQKENFKMIWIGGKPDKSDIDTVCLNKVSELGLNNWVYFTGNVGSKYYDYFKLANGFILTSEFESFSMASLEALFLGLPVVANNCLGVNEVVEDKFGYVVKNKNDSSEFVNKMIEYMNDEISFNKDELKQRALKFDAKIIASKWSSIINAML